MLFDGYNSFHNDLSYMAIWSNNIRIGARQVLENKLQRRSQSRLLQAWHNLCVYRRLTLRPLAIQRHQLTTRKIFLTRWKTTHRVRRERQIQADVVRDALLRERMLGTWLKRYRRSRILKWVKERKTTLLQWTFQGRCFFLL